MTVNNLVFLNVKTWQKCVYKAFITKYMHICMQCLTPSQLFSDHGERRSHPNYLMKDFRWPNTLACHLRDFKNDIYRSN